MDDVAAAAARASATTAPTSFTSSASRRGAPRRSRPDSGGAESRPRLLAPGGWFSEVHVGWLGRRGGGPVPLLGLFGDHCLGRHEQAGDGCVVLQRLSLGLVRIVDTCLDPVLELVCL